MLSKLQNFGHLLKNKFSNFINNNKMGVRRLMVKLVGIFIVSSVYSNYLFMVYLSAKC